MYFIEYLCISTVKSWIFTTLSAPKETNIMKTYPNTALPCTAFGHNYIKTKINNDQTSELTCNHCGIVVNTDTKGNFEHISNPDTHIKRVLRKLYHLRLQSVKAKLSA